MYYQSEQINELATALAKAQGAMEGALKDSSNPFFKSKYADLASVWSACRKALTDNGLSVVQLTSNSFDIIDAIQVTTQLCHSSGQWISASLTMKPVKTDPQSVGSLLTYMRRYGLSAMVGIAPKDDDDGNAASGKTEEVKVISPSEATTINETVKAKGVDVVKFLQYMNCESIESIPADKFKVALNALRSAKGKGVANAAVN